MRSHAKASTVGSTQRQAGRLGRIFRGAIGGRGVSPAFNGSGAPKARALVLAAAVLALALAADSASASKTHNFKEKFGSAEQPSFTNVNALAVDQSNGDLLVWDSGEKKIKRFNPDGTPHNFSALGSNVIDGVGGADTTPQNEIAYGEIQEFQIAVDNSGTATDGDIYVTQPSKDVVDVFASSGAYLGQLSGFTQAGGGSFSEPCGVAVDPLGNVYVGDFSSADLVHKYHPSANPPVNADNVASFNSLAGESSPCTLAAGAGPTAGFIFVNRFNGELFKLDSTTGELKYQLPNASHRTVSIDPGTGHVFAVRNTDTSTEVVEYDASGATEATQAAAFKPGRTTFGLAVDGTSGLVYRGDQLRVDVYDAPIVTAPDVTTTAATNNTGARATLNGTVNPDGVELSECYFEWGAPLQFDHTTPCAETPAEIGTGTSPVAVHADLSGLEPNGITYEFRLVAKNPDATVKALSEIFTTPSTVLAETASGIAPTAATLNGTVNPDGETLTECAFEWGPLKAPDEQVQLYPETAPCVPGPGGITGTSPVAVHADLSDLAVGGNYVYRLRAGYPGGTVISGSESLLTTGPVIEASWSAGVTRTEATLKAAINPKESATTYRFEWGPTTAYGSSDEGEVGSDGSGHEVGHLVEGLTPDTTYHYRVIATSGVAENVGPDRTFTTYPPLAPDTTCANQANRYGASANLADCRAYEMVSPVDKNGGAIRTGSQLGNQSERLMQSSHDGEKLAYTSATAFADALSGLNTSQYIASRGAGGWSTHAINAPQGPATWGTIVVGNEALVNRHMAFSPDLSTSWLYDYNKTPLASGTVEGFTDNFYQRDNTADTYRALGVGAHFGGNSSVGGYSDDLSVVAVNAQLAESSGWDAFVSSGGVGHRVGILPNGTASFSSAVGSYLFQPNRREANTVGAVSSDGSRIFFTTGAASPIYVRENPTEEQSAFVGEECTEPAKACTRRVSSAAALFWAGSHDGSQVLYSEGDLSQAQADLYLYDVDDETATPIAGEVNGVAGQSEDLSRVYFVSEEDLAPGGIAGERNLYLYREGALNFIAALSLEDTHSVSGGAISDIAEGPLGRVARVTPDGEAAVFMSDRSLTGYDNLDFATGKPASEVYRYDAATDELTCVSCNPSGARPQAQPIPTMFDRTGIAGFGAAWIPSWEHSIYASRVISGDGNRVFFNAFDALVPGDTNGVQDVYEWEAQGTGSCTEPGGCVGLISTGQSKDESEFLDANADGRDVFFQTKSSILPQDPGLIDVYDARAGGGYPPPPPPPPPCVGDACQTPPAAPNDPTPASAGFRGAGDPQPRRVSRRCRARNRHAGKRAKHRVAKRCKRAKRGAGR